MTKRDQGSRCRAVVLIVAGSLSAMTGCSRVSLPSIEDAKIPGVYRLAIQQGNVLDPEALSQLEPGLTKRKVSFLIGTPAVQDVFHQERWDYVYTYQRGGGDREQRVVSLHFSGDILARIEGDVDRAHASGSRRNAERVVVVPSNARQRSLLSVINPWADDRPRGAVAESATPADTAGEEPSAGARAIGSEAQAPTSTTGTGGSHEDGTAQEAIAAARAEKESAEKPHTDKESVSAGDETKTLFERLAERFSFPDSTPSGRLDYDR